MSAPTSPENFSWDRVRSLLKLLAESLLRKIPELRRRADRSDIVQEAVLKALEKWEQLKNRDARDANTVNNWLCRIVRNEYKDTVAKHLRHCRSIGDEKSLNEAIEHTSLNLEKLVGSRAMSAFDPFDLAEALDKLKPDERAVVVAQFFEGKSLREIEGDTGISRTTASRLLAKAIKRLRSLLDGYNPQPRQEPSNE